MQLKYIKSLKYLARYRKQELLGLLKKIKLRSILDVLACYDNFSKRPNSFTDIHVRGFPSPLRLRNRTSDFNVFRGVILEDQYKLPGCWRETDPNVIIDAGANIGLTSAYFGNRFPNCRIIAVEPDSENLLIANHNLSFIKERCTTLHRAVWSHKTFLKLKRNDAPNQGHWATQTIPTNINPSGLLEDTELVETVTIEALMDNFSIKQIDLLKIDIEGAEKDIFKNGSIRFLDFTHIIAIELHGSECEAVFRSAIKGRTYHLEQQGELLVVKNNQKNYTEFTA